MSKEFNKKLMLDNISFALKEFGKKIGELETEAGVSPGYISRTSKDSNAKPGIDFIIRAAEALNISVDTLLNVDLSELTATEKYLISFLEKLVRDTTEDKLDWNQETADRLNRLEPRGNGYVSHPLFTYETFLESDEIATSAREVSRVVFVSQSFGCHTYINGDCFNLRLKDKAVLYLMDISKSVFSIDDTEAYAKEIWMYKPSVGVQFLCSNKVGSPLAPAVNNLYSIVKEFARHPKLGWDIRHVIDAYMRDDMNDDSDELPF